MANELTTLDLVFSNRHDDRDVLKRTRIGWMQALCGEEVALGLFDVKSIEHGGEQYTYSTNYYTYPLCWKCEVREHTTSIELCNWCYDEVRGK
jgi:hypothetical protein